jgi:hypothetical protein
MGFLPETNEIFPPEWHTLRGVLLRFVGERAVSLFAYSISDASHGLVCSVQFRRILIDHGEDPDHPQVTDVEQLMIDWGRLIATDPAGITPEFYAKLEQAFNEQLRVPMVAFAGQTVAANVFAIVGQVPLDKTMYRYRKPGDERTS